jgi:hypothetical protein
MCRWEGGLKLKPEDREALTNYVGKLFDNGVVGYGKYLNVPVSAMFDFDEALEKIRPRIEQLHNGKGLPDLAKNSLFSLVDVDMSSKENAPLSDCITLARDEVITSVVSDLISPLPKLAFVFLVPESWTEAVRLVLGLPIRAARAGFGATAFFESTKIVTDSKAVRQRLFRPQSLLGIQLSEEQAKEYLSGKGGLVIAGEGLHGAYATEALDAATDLAAAVYAVLAVYGLLRFKLNWDATEWYVPVFRRTDSKLEIWDTAQRRADLSEFERRFGPTATLAPDDALELKRALLIVMSTLQEAVPISLALYWLFRTFLDRSSQENILDVAIALEILGGARSTRDDPSISSTVAQKVAYAIGRSYRERTEIEKTIKQFYGLRSAVIHAGKRRLTSEEDVLVFSATEYCKRFIKHEISVLSQDLDWDRSPDSTLPPVAQNQAEPQTQA